MTNVHKFLAGAKALFDAIASIPGPEQKAIIGAAVSILAGFGLLHAYSATALTNEVFAVVVVLVAAGLAVEKALNGAANYRASFTVDQKK